MTVNAKYHFSIDADISVDEIDTNCYDGLILPGGMAPEKLRQNQSVIDAVKSFDDAKKMLSEYFGFKFSGDAKKDSMVINAAELKKLQDNFEKDRLHLAAMNIIARKAGIGWNSGSHTALPVLTTSIGCGAEIFTGFFENTDISRKINTLL